jgi:hypothetical protein
VLDHDNMILRRLCENETAWEPDADLEPRVWLYGTAALLCGLVALCGVLWVTGVVL